MRLPALTRREVLGTAAVFAGMSIAGATACDRRETETGEASGLTGMALIRAELEPLLQADPLPMETGYRRLEDGMWMIASLHHVPNVTGRMLEWWHRRRKTVEEFKMWHPPAHVHCEFDADRKVNVWHHLVDGEVQKTKGRPQHASAYFDAAAVSKAGVSATLCARGGPLEPDIWAMHIVHVCRDTSYGCEVRTRVFAGDFDPAPPAIVRPILVRLFGEERARWLMRHQSEEHVYLAGFLPALYEREAG
jgi:hypothetical protein